MAPRCCRNCDVPRWAFPKDVCKPELLMAAEMVGKCPEYQLRQGWAYAGDPIKKYKLGFEDDT